jgi:predicted nucleotidyltransferase
VYNIPVDEDTVFTDGRQMTAYADVMTALADANVRFVVTGGAAIALHGFARPIADFDIVVDPALPNLDAVERCLAQLGFRATLPLPLSTVVVMRMLDATGREVDVNRLYPVPFASLLERASPVSVEGRSIPIASRDDLIAIKRQRGRDYDLTDIALLEGAGAG